MSYKIDCHASIANFDELHRLVNTARRNTKHIKVPKQTLLNVLMDHSSFYGALEKHGYTINEPTEPT